MLNKTLDWAKTFTGGGLVFLFATSPVLAWDKHQLLMPFILKHDNDPRAEGRDTPLPNDPLQKFLSESIQIPNAEQDQILFKSLISELLLHERTGMPMPFTLETGTPALPGQTLSARTILIGNSIDDPDHGMDQNLPSFPGNSYDPLQERSQMGGLKGLSSQGFRHMYFGGWKLSYPLATFQIPFRPMGQAPDRAEIFARKASELLKKGQKAWGIRLLTWSMHYLQDLSQPFHAVQLVSLKLPEWSDLMTWPPQDIFRKLTVDTTRIVSNFHLAFEDYIHVMIIETPGLFQDCLVRPERYTDLKFDPVNQGPREIALQVARSSVDIAAALGNAEIAFFGLQLKDPSVDIVHQKGDLDYLSYGSREDLKDPRKELHRITCEALAHASVGSRALLNWVLGQK